VTFVPIQATDPRSAIGASIATAAAVLETEDDSPLSSDSSARSAIASINRISAGTRSPVSSNTMSPRTRSRDWISRSWPSRTTRDCGASIRRKASSASSARHSCTNPKMPFSTTMARIAAASTVSPTTKEITAATTRIRISTLRNCRARMACHGVLRAASKAFGPSRASRRAASSVVSPRLASLATSSTTSAGGSACHAVGAGAVVPICPFVTI
jgi:hypothetical protein